MYIIINQKLFGFIIIVEKRKNMKSNSSVTSSTHELITTEHFNLILERLKANQNRKSTQHNYHRIWRQFGHFLLKLDTIPLSWDQRLCLYGTYLVEQGAQSSTLRSYMSALKKILRIDSIKVNDDKVMLGILIRGCKMENDRIYVREPIHIRLLEILLFELGRMYSSPGNSQPYVTVSPSSRSVTFLHPEHR